MTVRTVWFWMHDTATGTDLLDFDFITRRLGLRHYVPHGPSPPSDVFQARGLSGVAVEVIRAGGGICRRGRDLSLSIKKSRATVRLTLMYMKRTVAPLEANQRRCGLSDYVGAIPMGVS